MITNHIKKRGYYARSISEMESLFVEKWFNRLAKAELQYPDLYCQENAFRSAVQTLSEDFGERLDYYMVTHISISGKRAKAIQDVSGISRDSTEIILSYLSHPFNDRTWDMRSALEMLIDEIAKYDWQRLIDIERGFMTGTAPISSSFAKLERFIPQFQTECDRRLGFIKKVVRYQRECTHKFCAKNVRKQISASIVKLNTLHTRLPLTRPVARHGVQIHIEILTEARSLFRECDDERC